MDKKLGMEIGRLRKAQIEKEGAHRKVEAGIEMPKMDPTWNASRALDRAVGYLERSYGGSTAERQAAQSAALYAALQVVSSLAQATAQVPDGPIQEGEGHQEQWYKDAREMTLEQLPAFLAKLAAYNHDYGTAVHAVAAAAVAAAWAMNRTPAGGMTGFQAQGVKWEFLRGWLSLEGPARLLTFEEMLYPQNGEQFRTVLPPSIYEWLKTEAAKKLAEANKGEVPVGESVIAHWRDLARGWVPFGWSVEIGPEIVRAEGTPTTRADAGECFASAPGQPV